MANKANKSKHSKISRLGTPNCGAKTSIGRVREHNEDSLVVKEPLYAVLDGMGGHAAGEVASEIAANVLAEQAPCDQDSGALGFAVSQANLAVIDAAIHGRGKKGMGTTCTAAMLQGTNLILAQVGDSRAYLVHDGKIQQITRDHSLVADLVEQGAITKDYARVHPDRSKITRALGTDPHMIADTYEMEVSSGDRLLLCSDGLYSMITDEDIEHILNAEKDPQDAADRLVREANEWGGHDNITVIVVDVPNFTEVKKNRKTNRKVKLAAIFVVAALIALIAGSAFLVNTWVSNSAYLAPNNGKVAIYHGIPGSSVGNTNDNLGETTSVSLDDLDEAVVTRMSNGEIKFSSYDEAKQLVETYKKDIEEKKSKNASSASESQDSASGTTNNQQSSTKTTG